MNHLLQLGLLACVMLALMAAGWVWQRRHRNAGIVDVLWAAGLGMAAAELLPVIGTIRESTRLELTYGQLVDHSLPIHHLPMLLFPFMFGGPVGPVFQVPYWGAGPYQIELQGYAGLAPWALALVAAGSWRQDRRVRFFLVLAVVGGLVVSQVLTLYLTPVIYLMMDRLQRRFARPSGQPANATPR